MYILILNSHLQYKEWVQPLTEQFLQTHKQTNKKKQHKTVFSQTFYTLILKMMKLLPNQPNLTIFYFLVSYLNILFILLAYGKHSYEINFNIIELYQGLVEALCVILTHANELFAWLYCEAS